ncbi:hypothetical protein E4U39_005677 [Claviceps sp. Clav50 group G5]|nr:hypothetical protein E4U39_005677 [Claviceps sp. Clav50 group G5]
MQDQSPAVLETNLRANLKIKPEMPKKNKQEWAFILRKPWKKFLPEPCRLAGGIVAHSCACTLSVRATVIVLGSASQLTLIK